MRVLDTILETTKETYDSYIDWVAEQPRWKRIALGLGEFVVGSAVLLASIPIAGCLTVALGGFGTVAGFSAFVPAFMVAAGAGANTAAIGAETWSTDDAFISEPSSSLSAPGQDV